MATTAHNHHVRPLAIVRAKSPRSRTVKELADESVRGFHTSRFNGNIGADCFQVAPAPRGVGDPPVIAAEMPAHVFGAQTFATGHLGIRFGQTLADIRDFTIGKSTRKHPSAMPA